MAHSFLPPSGAAAWSRCAMWPTMNAQYPQDDSPESIEGTAAHWVVSEMLAGRQCTEGQTAPNGVIITGEMLDGADLVSETVGRRIPNYGQIHIEETVTIAEIHPDCFGTPDVWAFNAGTNHVEIIDYKFGHGFVEEHFNPQGLLYLLGVLAIVEPKILGDVENVTASFTIVQPRCFYRGEPVRTHSFRVKEIAPYVRDLRAAALAATQSKPAATTNLECKYCPGRHTCSTLQLAAYSDAEFSNDRQPFDLSPNAAALELRMLERALSRLEARVDGLRELTLANIKAGANIPYYHAEPGRGRQQWTATPEQIITVGQMLGKDLSKPGVVTPAQAKKIGIDESVIIAYSVNTPGSIKLVAANNENARKVFSATGE